MTYASGTSVPVERSRAELETLLAKHGADQRGIATDDTRGVATITFRICACGSACRCRSARTSPA